MMPTLLLTAHPDFMDMATAELRHISPQATWLRELAPGIWAVHTPSPFTALAPQWQQQPPIFVRHICPVHTRLPLTATPADVTTLTRTVKQEFARLIDPTLSFSVQTRLLATLPYRRYVVNTTLSDAIEQLTGAPLNTSSPVQVLSVVITGEAAYMGLSLARHNLSNWAGGMHHFAREKEQISRSEFKLLEALAVFQIDLPPRGQVLDLGAAPGGWTRVLRQKEQYVTAVDPANLHPSLQTDNRVRHKRITAEAYLHDDPDQFDMIVNDMRMDARDSARLMSQYQPCLYPHGTIIMTFKLPEQGRATVLDHAFNILRPTYDIAQARQLFHNRSEITVYLKNQPVS